MSEQIVDTSEQPIQTTESDGWEWMLVEIMGHRTHWGRARQEERFGAKMLRIDVPVNGDPITHGWETHYYGGASIFSFTLTDEAAVLKHNKPYEPAARYRLPPPDDDEAEDDDSNILDFGETSHATP